jgi:hypothetical protein
MPPEVLTVTGKGKVRLSESTSPEMRVSAVGVFKVKALDTGV